MKTRVISALVALIIVIPIFVTGGTIYNGMVYILGLLALKEFIEIKETKKEMPVFIKFISVVIFSLLILSNLGNADVNMSVDLRTISSLFLVFLIPVVIYHNDKTYSVNDAFYMIASTFFLGITLHLLILYRNISVPLLLYLFLITAITDTYAYVTGMLVGKHKMIESVSPKKTWEGFIGGTLMGTLIGCMFYTSIINSEIPAFNIIIISLFLSILGQIGDLVFSAIKRYYGKKDFSNIMPGHGGVLDRLDSIIFVMLGYLFFLAII